MPIDRSAIFGRVWAGGAVLGAAWLFYSQAIGPLQERTADSLRKLVHLRAHLATARGTIQQVREQEQEAGRARGELQRSHGDVRGGSPMVWFPDRMKQHFGRYGIPESVTRLNTALKEPGLPRCQRTYWAVDLPIQNAAHDIPKLLIAVAELEEAEPIVRVIDVAIRQDSGRRTAVCGVVAAMWFAFIRAFGLTPV